MRILKKILSKLILVTQIISNIPGRYIYGNVAGFKNNFSSNLQIKKIRREIKSSSLDYNMYRPNDLSNHLNEKGFLKVKSEMDLINLREIQDNFNALINDPENSIGGVNGAIRHIINPVKHEPKIINLLSNEIINTIRRYYQTEITVHTIRAWRNNHVDNINENREDVFSNTFHNDNYHSWGIRVFVLLSNEVSKKNGAFRFFEKTNTKKIVRKFGFLHRNFLSPGVRDFLEKKEDMLYFEGELGDVCICNTQLCLHGAGMPEKGTHRDIIQFEIYPAFNNGRPETIFANVKDDESELISVFS